MTPPSSQDDWVTLLYAFRWPIAAVLIVLIIGATAEAIVG